MPSIRIPKIRQRRAPVSREALDLWARLKRTPYGDEWRKIHSELHRMLGLYPWQWWLTNDPLVVDTLDRAENAQKEALRRGSRSARQAGEVTQNCPEAPATPQMSSANDRMKKLRRRRADGKIVVPVTIVEVDVVEALIDAGFLKPEEAEDRAAISLAMSRVFERMCYP